MAKSSKLANKFRLQKNWGIHSYFEICSKIDFTGQARRPVWFEMIWSLTKQTWHTCGIFLLVAAAKKSLCVCGHYTKIKLPGSDWALPVTNEGRVTEPWMVAVFSLHNNSIARVHTK